MKCPHCRESFHEVDRWVFNGSDTDGSWAILKNDCPACKRMILHLINGADPLIDKNGVYRGFKTIYSLSLFRPKGTSRPSAPAEVPKNLATDYDEACLVLSDSSKASAALSRRCLQNVLREAAKVKPGNLADEIQEVIDSGKLSAALQDSIDAVRVVGNFAAHPIKSKQTGEILDVEPGEAEWTLDVLDALFDHYYVQPEILKKKRAALNAKLAEAGKPSMK